MERHIVFIESSLTGAGALANRLARQAGYRVTLLSRHPEKYHSNILMPVHEIIHCDTNNVEVVIKQLHRLSRQHTVHAVTTTADMYVPQAAFGAYGLGLPGLSYDAALRARYKGELRSYLASRAPQFNPAYAIVSDVSTALKEAEAIGYPLVAKPQNENNSTAVRLITNSDQLEMYMAGARGWVANSAGQRIPEGVLLEAYVVGMEVSVETLQAKGMGRQVVGVTTKQVIGLERGYFIEVGHAFPFTGHEAYSAISAVDSVLDILDLDCGVMHTEIKISNDGQKIVEVNPRLAGGKIGSHLIELATGLNAVQAVIDIAFGKEIRWTPTQQKGAAIQFVWSNSWGTFEGIRNLAEIRELPGIVSANYTAEPGSQVRPPESNADVLAEVIAVGKDANDAWELVNRAVGAAKIGIAKQIPLSR